MEQVLFPGLILIPPALGLLAAFLPRTLRWTLLFMTSLAIATVLVLIRPGMVPEFSVTWPVAVLDRALGFHLAMSHTAWFFLVMTSLATASFTLFSLVFNDARHDSGIAPLYLALIGFGNGVFLAADWITFFVCWELASVLTLIIVGHRKGHAFSAGLWYFTLSAAGSLSLLAGAWWIALHNGSFLISDSLVTLASWITDGRAAAWPVLGLFSLAFLSKAALFPFHMWPAFAHAEAPDDFSPFLSGVLIKYGIYGLFLVWVPVFFHTPEGAIHTVSGIPWPLYILGWISALTAVVGTLMAIFSNDAKRLLAWSTVANLGYIGTALSAHSVLGTAAALFHLANHMVFKGAMFTTVAAVKWRTGEREMHRMGGLALRMPLTFLTFLLAIIAAAGIPPMSGFASKWMIFQALFQKGLVFQATMLFFASTGAFLYLYRALHSIFLGQLSTRHEHIREVPFLMMLPMIAFMLAMMAVGFAPGLILTPVNWVLSSHGLETVRSNWTIVVGSTSSIDFAMLFGTFVFAVALVFLFFVLGGRRKKVPMMDNYTSGETPSDWGLTPDRYQYAYAFYQPIRVLFARVPLGWTENFFAGAARSFTRAGSLFADAFSHAAFSTWSILLGVALLVLFGVLS
ncbi:hypothetical protein KKD52_05385 [Myxococcota bacterium]|nr:hypothetical protein [Myxococcota bacterium]MBU1413108.1 hypothetical protein [Myxococcota bacterium]MBU1509772.1 hypothetical protein [Myxococcota bacterium]